MAVDYFIDLISLQAVLGIWDTFLESVGFQKEMNFWPDSDANDCHAPDGRSQAILQPLSTLSFLICKVGTVSICDIILLWGTHEVPEANTIHGAMHMKRM